jgi:hypothetical protein
MIRPLSQLLLAGILGLVLQTAPLPAQNTTAKLPALADADVVRYLTAQQRQDWDAAQKQAKDAQITIDNANGLLAVKARPNTPDAGVAEAHQSGKEQLASGTALLAQANTTLAALRIAAQKTFATSQTIAAAGKFQLVVSASQWPDVVQNLSNNLMKSLWAANYTQIYLNDVYAFDRNHYLAKPALTAQVRDALQAADGDHKTLAAQGGVKLLRQGSALILDYPGRASTTPNGDSAVILGEVLFEPDSGYAYFSLRAVDLATGKIIHNELTLLSVEPTFGKGLDMVAYQVPSARIVPQAPVLSANKTAAPAANVSVATITLQDNIGLINTFKAAPHPYFFRTDTAGTNDTRENRVALLLLKSILAQKSPLTVTDYDFLVQAFPAADPDDRSATPASVNAVWQVSNLRDLDPASVSLTLKARSLASAAAPVTVGKLTVDTSLKPLSPPSPDQLTAAGYQLNPNPPSDAAQSSSSAVVPSAPAASPSTSAGLIKHSP